MLGVYAVVLVPRKSGLPYQNRIADEQLMASFLNYPLEPSGPARGFDPDHGRLVDRRVKLPYLLNIVRQLQCACLTRLLITPTKRLLVGMKVNSDVKCHNGFSCQRADLCP
jgi:hypothetical protein